MIESISIAQAATFGNSPETLEGLSHFNFIFGSNGTGKTTISRIIADESAHPVCRVTWKSGTKLQSIVYNRDFVERNFNQSPELKGVFTLGEKHVETLSKIAAAKLDRDRLTGKIESSTSGLQGDDGNGGKKKESADLETGLKELCWKQKQKYDAKLQGAFEGYRGSAEKFKGKILQEQGSNAASLLTLLELEKKSETIFGNNPTSEQAVPTIDFDNLVTHESNVILKKRVLGKEDVDIAGMIKRLGNNDWVRAGLKYYEVNEKACPFCQQSTTEAFAQGLEKYFDETFEADSLAIGNLIGSYKADSELLQRQIAALTAAPSRFLNLEKFKIEKELFESIVMINIQRLTGKAKEPSQIVELESINKVAEEIVALILVANAQILEHNRLVENILQERRTLTAQVWKYLLETELKADLVSYSLTRSALDKAIAGMTEQIREATLQKGRKDTEIRELEKQTTSIQPTIDGINTVLRSYGFHSFSMATASNGTSYKLIRSDGTDAKTTLSEGEKGFVTFLYFYHLLKGSESDSGITIDRVVVIDDPVSSLDSDVLFVVGSLIKGLFAEVRAKTGHIKQVFVLTHNIYFHKEVTYASKRPNNKVMKEETFWVVRKSGLLSKVIKHTSNPIKTSYELLWAEIRNSDRSNLTIQNTLRRILENYFRILGGVDPDIICAKFEGQERLICNSLFSWIHDGSHHAGLDLYHSTDHSTVDSYLRVFRAIFEKAEHAGHYKMMMGDAWVESIVEEVKS